MYFLEQRVKLSCKTCDCELLLWSEVQEVKWGVTSWMMSVQYTSWKKMIIEDTADLFMVDKKYPLAFTVLVNVISMPKWYVIILYEFKDIKMSILYNLHDDEVHFFGIHQSMYVAIRLFCFMSLF